MHNTVCVIGPLPLQNELITRALEKQADVKCLAAGSMNEARSRFGDAFDRATLFLWDCATNDLAREIEALKRIEGLMPQNSSLGLFNVKSSSWGNGLELPTQVKGVFLDNTSGEDFMRGVCCMIDGKSWLPVDKTVQAPATGGVCVGHPDDRDEHLTPREQFLLSLIQQGKSNREIADEVGVKYKTIKNYTNKLFKKINVSNRDEAGRWAKRNL